MFAQVSETPAVQALLRRLEKGGVLSCAGVNAAAQPFIAVLLRTLLPGRPIVVVTDGLKMQESFQQDIETWMAFQSKVQSPRSKVVEEPAQPNSFGAKPLFYPAWEIMPHEPKLPHADVISERLETLVLLSANSEGRTPNSAIVVTSVAALLQRTFPARALRERTRLLSRGDRIEPLDLVEWLEEQGYEPEAEVSQRGEISLRGGILDIYPMTSPWPVRLEFFGDELESLRYFDPRTQISRDQIESVTLPPGGELGILKRARSGESSERNDGNEELATLLDYLPRQTIFLLCEPDRLAEQADQYAGQAPENDPFLLSWQEFQDALRERGMTSLAVCEVSDSPVEFQAVDQSLGTTDSDVSDESHAILDPQSSTLNFQSLDAFRPLGTRAPDPQIAEAQRREFFAQIHRWSRQSYAVHVFCNNAGERQRFEEILKDYGFDSEGSITIQIGALSRGFVHDESRVVVITDAEVFGRYRVQRPRRLKSPHAQAARSALDIDFTELEEGDYVVHLQHGIGRYLGLKVLPVSTRGAATETPGPESGQECLVIEYAPSGLDESPPKLYVPVTEAHLVSKYVGAGKARPPLNTLGGNRWAKAKENAERAVRDVAGELLAIQAARESQPGHAFAPDNPWQREFESAFLYEETPDQMRAIVETKADMERPKPMDRLICGDVGFGKTEVAIRAAFKAVMDGRQVAVLVPTTVLAQQHFNTFRERMADYPVRIELLSRFRTPRERKSVVQDLPAGSVDIVIGTHRLLQKDIAFKDLGLVIIDEEQRFGVMHKEKFKQLRRLVDVLTLSATPIPRTLYLALTGARDMSTIETPPQDRLPVETIVAQYDERLIRDAIQRELNRGGQVFFLHNRVNTIDTMAQKLRSLLPHARIVVGHGQMDGDDLEEIMTQFVNGEADVLLSTTIIESGLDIPNANTILIDRADRFGLSDLYQLRGRVGRYKHQAYAYLLLPRHAGLLADARKRITALKQYSTLGSGFKIAMRDLEIRGAGNMLGPEQSGQITAVGFDLYCQLLKQSVAALKG
ncbi:MAG TPA: transcription-repair coupling factor, partial [Verrucomicrobiae bacterium]|nr:transcription-repair coupling factor [Verrucomicrobiae bacterium]